MRRIEHSEWVAAGTRRYGLDPMAWRFRCPSCQHVASVLDYRAAGFTEGGVAYSCVGRNLPVSREAFVPGAGPCDYTSGGLFNLSPIEVVFPDGTSRPAFDFADDPLVPVSARPVIG